MTDPNYSALLLILDRSGSMEDIRHSMIEGMNTLLRDQAAAPGLLTVDVLHFDDRMRFTHKFSDPSNVFIEIEPRGGTALNDAIAYGITDLRARIQALPEHARPQQVEVVIVTDGLENASTEFGTSQIRELIEQQRSLGWEFTFLGADQDATLEGGAVGIEPGRSLSFRANDASVGAATRSASKLLAKSRASQAAQFDKEDRDEAANSSTATTGRGAKP